MPAPNTPQDLIDRIRDLERQIRDLTGRMNIRPALNTIVGGSVTVKGGGTLVVEDLDGDTVLSIGRAAPDVDGQPQQATIIRRIDGSMAFAVWTSDTSGVQPVRIYDLNSKVIVADDLVAGGLAQPWVPLPLPTSNQVAQWPSTTSTTLALLSWSRVWVQHPKMYVELQTSMPSDTTGNIQVRVGGTIVLTTDASVSGVYDVPAWAWGGTPQSKLVEVYAQRLTGTGSVSVQMKSLYGRQS